MIRRLSVLSILPLLVATLTVAAPAQSSAAAAGTEAVSTAKSPVLGKRCRNAGKTVYVLRDIRHEIRVAYAKTFVLAPSQTIGRVRDVRRDMTLSADYHVTGGVDLGAKGIAKLALKAELQIGVDFVGLARIYSAERTTVRTRVHNPTNRNKKYVAYKATHQYAGKYTQFFCADHPVMTHPEWTIRSKGTWKTHQPLEVGTIRCGAGAAGSISVFVARRHCD